MDKAEFKDALNGILGDESQTKEAMQGIESMVNYLENALKETPSQEP